MGIDVLSASRRDERDHRSESDGPAVGDEIRVGRNCRMVVKPPEIG